MDVHRTKYCDVGKEHIINHEPSAELFGIQLEVGIFIYLFIYCTKSWAGKNVIVYIRSLVVYNPKYKYIVMS